MLLLFIWRSDQDVYMFYFIVAIVRVKTRSNEHKVHNSYKLETPKTLKILQLNPSTFYCKS